MARNLLAFGVMVAIKTHRPFSAPWFAVVLLLASGCPGYFDDNVSPKAEGGSGGLGSDSKIRNDSNSRHDAGLADGLSTKIDQRTADHRPTDHRLPDHRPADTKVPGSCPCPSTQECVNNVCKNKCSWSGPCGADSACAASEACVKVLSGSVYVCMSGAVGLNQECNKDQYGPWCKNGLVCVKSSSTATSGTCRPQCTTPGYSCSSQYGGQCVDVSGCMVCSPP